MRRTRGFTLIEAMVAIAVLGILLVVALPGMQKVMAKQRMRSASYDVMSDITLARSEALKRNSTVVMEPLSGTDWRSGWRVRNTADNTILAQRPAIGASLAMSVLQGTTPQASVSFTAAAQVASGGTLRFSLNDGYGNSRCIQLDPAGRPKSANTACT